MFTLDDNLQKPRGMLGGNILTFFTVLALKLCSTETSISFLFKIELVQWNANVGDQVNKVRETVITIGLDTLRNFTSSVAFTALHLRLMLLASQDTSLSLLSPQGKL